MDDTFYSSLNNLQDVIGQELSSLDFWSSEKKIEEYSVSILKYFGFKNPSVHVRFSQGAFEVSNSTRDDFYIEVPAIPICKDDISYRKQIYARSLILRHELGHALFSDTNIKLKKIKEHPNFNAVFRAVEDSRVEALLAETLKGTKHGFKQLNGVFFNTPEKINKMLKPVFLREICLTYFQLRSKDFSYEIANPVVEKYEELFKKFRWVLKSHDTRTVYNAYIEFAEDMIKAKQDFKNEDSQKNDNTETDEDDNKEENNDDNNTKESNDEKINIEDIEIDEENDHEESDDSSEDNIEIDEECADGGNTKTSEDAESDKKAKEHDEKGEDTSKIEDSKTNGTNSEVSDADDKDDVDSENSDDEDDDDADSENSGDDEDDDDEDADSENSEVNSPIDSLLKDIQDTYTIDFSDFFKNGSGLDNFKLDLNMFREASSINLGTLFQITKSGMYTPSGNANYNRVVFEYRKQINQVIRFLSLKLQNKNRSRAVINQEEGELDQDNLKNLVIDVNNPRAFMRIFKALEVQSRVIFLVDGSASMSTSQLQQCIMTIILLVEVCKRLKITYEISFFTNPREVHLSASKNITFLKIFQLFKKSVLGFEISGKTFDYKNHSFKDFNNSDVARKLVQTITMEPDRDTRGAVYLLKSGETPHSRNVECLLGNLYDFNKLNWLHNKFSGGTPEFSSFINVYKRNMKFRGNKIMFILNDGNYDSYEVRDFLPKTNLEFSFNAHKISIYNTNLIEFDRTNSLIMMVNYIIKKLHEFKDDPTNIEQLNSTCYGRTFEKKDVKEAIQTLIKNWEVILNAIPSTEFYAQITDNEENIFAVLWSTQEKGRIKSISIEISENQNTAAINSAGTFIDQIINSERLVDVVYAKAINQLRKRDFRIAGFGIHSSAGVNYIGADNFAVLKNVQDLKDSFAKKLMQIF